MGGRWENYVFLLHSSLHYRLIVFFLLNLRCWQSDTVVTIDPQCLYHWWQSTTGVILGKMRLPSSVTLAVNLLTVPKMLTVNFMLQISPRIFRKKNSKWRLWNYQVPVGRWFAKKIWSQKSPDTVLLVEKLGIFPYLCPWTKLGTLGATMQRWETPWRDSPSPKADPCRYQRENRRKIKF